MIIKVPLYFDPLNALKFNLNDLENEVKIAFCNLLCDDIIWVNIAEKSTDDPDLIDSCVECIQELDDDEIWEFVKYNEDTLQFSDYEAEDYLEYKIDVDFNFDGICDKYFHQRLHFKE